MRSFGSVVTGLVAVLAFAVFAPMLWLTTNVADEDGYVELSGVALSDPERRAEVADAVEVELTERTTGHLQDLGVPQVVIDGTTGQIDSLTEEGLAEESVAQAWADAQRQAHQEMFAGKGSTGSGFVIELAPLMTAAASAVGVDGNLFGASVRVESENEVSKRFVWVTTHSLAITLISGAVLLAAAGSSFVLARRKHLALLGLGVAGLGVIGVEYLLARFAPDLVGLPDDAGISERLGHVVLEIAADSFQVSAIPVAIGAAAVFGAGVLLSALRGLFSR
ncbi:MAG: hypothetical protein QM621_13510 [Aeromicrobium sp.]|uniref:hypothetical protein n=1 Tax=Aeromicrobium sp. TaxID=1871063 RepID=UPI0039E59055